MASFSLSSQMTHVKIIVSAPRIVVSVHVIIVTTVPLTSVQQYNTTSLGEKKARTDMHTHNCDRVYLYFGFLM